MLHFILTAISLLPASAWAASDPYAVEIQPPAQVRFVDVDACSSTFEIELIGEEGAGPFYVSDQEILASVSAINRK